VSKTKAYFFEKPARKIEPSQDPSKHKLAQEKLALIRASHWDLIPERFKANWEDVALYNPKGSVEDANALLLDPENGAFDLSNRINHLTGKEWVKFTCSWFIFNALPSDLAEEREIDPSAARHPATYSPTMTSSFIEFFTKEGMTVLDPFMGIGTTLAACHRTKRSGIGIELNEDYFKIAQKRVPSLVANMHLMSAEDLHLLDLPEIDYSISSPPYWDVLNRSTKDFKKKRDQRSLDSKYSDREEDLGNVHDYEQFLDRTCDVYLKVAEKMRSGAYMTIIVKNVKKDGKLYPLAWDIARKLSSSLDLKDERIWIQDKVGLAPYGYPHSWTSNILHHYCLNLQKP
jgi:DNA modification methylase